MEMGDLRGEIYVILEGLKERQRERGRIGVLENLGFDEITGEGRRWTWQCPGVGEEKEVENIFYCFFRR